MEKWMIYTAGGSGEVGERMQEGGWVAYVRRTMRFTRGNVDAWKHLNVPH